MNKDQEVHKSLYCVYLFIIDIILLLKWTNFPAMLLTSYRAIVQSYKLFMSAVHVQSKDF